MYLYEVGTGLSVLISGCLLRLRSSGSTALQTDVHKNNFMCSMCSAGLACVLHRSTVLTNMKTSTWYLFIEACRIHSYILGSIA